MRRQTILPFEIKQTDMPLIARGGLMLPYEMAKALRLLDIASTISTVRWKLYQVAGAIVKHAHRILLKLAAPIDKIALFHKFRLRCFRAAYG